MTIVVQGADAVRRLERALYGELPHAAIAASQADLTRHVVEKLEHRKAALAQTAALEERARARLFPHITKDDPGIKHDLAELRAILHARKRPPRPATPNPYLKSVPRVVAGSFEWYKNPPFDAAWTSPLPSNGSADVSADQTAGTYNIVMQSLEQGAMSAGAGVAVFFGAPAEDTMQSFNAIINYSDDWWSSAYGYTADNQLQTYLWVWGVTENAWVGQANITPSWSDHAKWFDNDGNNPQGDSGFTGTSVMFPAAANQQYVAWAWSGAFLNTSGGFFGGSFAFVQFNALVQYVSFSTPG